LSENVLITTMCCATMHMKLATIVFFTDPAAPGNTLYRETIPLATKLT